jgi:hypothetical protein
MTKNDNDIGGTCSRKGKKWKEINLMEYLGIDMRIILKFILNK